MKRSCMFVILLILISVGCSDDRETDQPTISMKTDSEYEDTFEGLNLGVLFDFDFYLPNADKRWVNLWVERYSAGTKDPQSLTELSYGNSPEEMEEGRMGFGMINPNAEDTLVFLYGPGVSTQPSRIEKDFRTDVISSWDYAIGKEKVELKLGETKILAAYRETGSNSMRTIDYQDEESVNNMIKQNDTVLLLKIKVEEKMVDSY
ncbi:MAG: hypothetical protein ACQEWI_07750 [Bacillota bacterium]